MIGYLPGPDREIVQDLVKQLRGYEASTKELEAKIRDLEAEIRRRDEQVPIWRWYADGGLGG